MVLEWKCDGTSLGLCLDAAVDEYSGICVQSERVLDME